MDLWNRTITYDNLILGWKKVKKNKSAPGLDGITVNDYESAYKAKIYNILDKLKSGLYEHSPIKIESIQSNDKMRKIGLLCLEDKIVEHAVLNGIEDFFEKDFSDSSFAYRSGKSAIIAVNKLGKILANDKSRYNVALLCDIKDFFENVKHEKLIEILRTKISDAKIIDLINLIFKVPRLVDNEFIKYDKGICQGSIIAPFFSNVYLNNFDKSISDLDCFYIRYSDDLLILTKDKNSAEEIKDKIKIMLEEIGLELRKEKTRIVEIEESFEFLGYIFNKTGTKIPDKSINNLNEKIEKEWNNSIVEIDVRLKNIEQILRGWEQYHGDLEKPTNVYLYLLYLKKAVDRNDLDFIDKLIDIRDLFSSDGYDLTNYLANLWRNLENYKMALNEYLMFMGIFYNDNIEINDIEILLDKFEMMFKFPENSDLYDDIVQLTSDLSMYGVSEEIFKRKNLILEESKDYSDIKVDENNFSKSNEIKKYNESNLSNKWKYKENDVEQFINLFVAREDKYVIDFIGEDERRSFKNVSEILDEDVVKKHLDGDLTVAGFVNRINNSVKFLVIDIDIYKKVLIEGANNPEIIKNASIMAHKTAVILLNETKKVGIKAYIEGSGYKGRHVWIFFENWTLASNAVNLGKVLISKIKKIHEDIRIELFPSKGRIKRSKDGQVIKLPLGIHQKSGNRGLFLDENSVAFENQFQYLSKVELNSISQVRKVINTNLNLNNSSDKINEKIDKLSKRNIDELKPDSDMVRAILKGCSLMKYLCFKCKDTGYLTHFERLHISYVFGHIDDTGKKFIHNIMSMTLNYDYGITQKFINRIPGKPVSCVKLRAEYKNITSSLPCNCYFKLAKKCYPSPVLHSVAIADDDEITLPVSMNASGNEKGMKEQMDINKSAEKLAAKLIEIRKQIRNIEKNRRKYEEQLNTIFNNMKINELDIDIGTLVRNKNNDGDYDWIIEI